MGWRCVKDSPTGVALDVGPFGYKPVCPFHGTKACIVSRKVHHVDGCAQSKKKRRRGPRTRPVPPEILGPQPYCVEDVSKVDCENCRAKLKAMGKIKPPVAELRTWKGAATDD